jgi:dipeptidyl-peptidase-4
MNPRASRTPMLIVALLALAAVSLFCQEPKRLTLDSMSDPSLRAALQTPRTWWLDNNTAILYDTRTSEEERTLQQINPSTGQRSALLDKEKAAQSFAALFSDEELPRFSPVPQQISGSGRYGLYLIRGDLYLLDIPAAAFTRITKTEVEEQSANFSPDGLRVAFVRGNNLFVYDIATRSEHQLTSDGTETTLNGTLSWVYWEEIFGRRDIGYWWSGDSRTIAYLQTDESQVSTQHYVDISPWTPTVTTQKYPKVGEKNPSVRVGIIDVGSSTTTWASIDPASYEYVARVDWLPDNKRFSVRTLNRLQTELRVYLIDRASGKATHILTDTNPGWINISDDFYFLQDGKHLIMASERDGYEHLYRFTLDGKLVNQITKGEWAIRSSGGGPFWLRQAVTGIDEKGGWIYFTALEKSPLEKHLYRVKMDGSGFQRLSQGDGTHAISMSPDAQYYFDRYSNVTTPPSLTLHGASGKAMTELAPPTLAGFKTYDVQFAELMYVPARDGFQLPVALTKPRDFDPTKKYPVIVNVYGGPSAPQVSNSFSAGAIWENVLGNEGFICMTVDNRAATAVSKNLENLLLKRTPGEIELNDLVDAVRWMKTQSWVDPDRIGLWGWSGGGTNTLLGMTRSTEFKAGIAGAGVTDFRFYDTKWGEAMMKTEKENLEGYEASSLIQFAKDLHGKVLIIHNTHDDNVHIQNSWQFIDELIKADKLFELMVYPMRGHGVGDPPGRKHLNHLMLDFWTRNL